MQARHVPVVGGVSENASSVRHVSPGVQLTLDAHVSPIPGIGSHRFWVSHRISRSHVPQLPPQPSEPQVFPVQSATQQDPLRQLPSEHVPHVPPQPSGPHTFPVQRGWHSYVVAGSVPPPLHAAKETAANKATVKRS
jgi:hypothetical protein